MSWYVSIQPSSGDSKLFQPLDTYQLTRPCLALQNVGNFLNFIFCSLILRVLYENKLKKNKKKYALRTLNGSFLDAKTFDLEIG